MAQNMPRLNQALSFVPDRQQIINLLEDNNWDEETVANTLLYYSV